MSVSHKILVEGNSLSFKGGFFGFSTVALIRVKGSDPVLFDTGHHSTRLLLLQALEREGLTPESIRTVFLSHLHFDHANNLDLFPNATVHVGAAEWAYAHNPAAGDIFFSVGMNEYLQRRKPHLIGDSEGELAPGLHYRHAPGHTPGSYLLHYTAESGQRVVLAGDACKTCRELARLQSANEFDPACRASTTLRWIAKNADVVIPGHFPPLYKTASRWLWDEPSRIEIVIR